MVKDVYYKHNIVARIEENGFPLVHLILTVSARKRLAFHVVFLFVRLHICYMAISTGASGTILQTGNHFTSIIKISVKSNFF